MTTMGAATWLCDISSNPGFSVSPVRRHLAVIAAHSILLWDVCHHKPVINLKLTFGGRKAGLFSPVKDVLAFGSLDRIVRHWQVNNRDVCSTLVGHAKEVKESVFSPNGWLLASACQDMCIV
jgi:WD40 repeat protein